MGALTDFPGVNQVRVGNRSFQINTSFEPYRRDAFRHRTIPAQRESINVGGKTGEGTVNSEGLWRWNALDWSYGGGQLFADREGTVPNRFYQSKGVTPWVQFQLSLLQDTVKQRASTNTPKDTTSAISLGPFVFIKKPQTVEYTTDFITFTAVPSLPVLTGSDIYTFLSRDNANVYVSSPTKGVFVIPVGATVGAATNPITDAADWVAAAGGRVFMSQGASLYDISSPPANAHVPTPLFTHSETNWVWQTAVSGASSIYFSGSAQVANAVVANTFSGIYRSTIEADGTALQAPVVALTLPHNEFCNILFNYLNYIFVGTTQGVRMCRTVSANDPSGNSGDLISGPLIPNYLGPASPATVTGFCANGRYVWFAWQGASGGGTSGYDGVSVGLGRLDLGTMVEDLAPAYASDLMITDPAAYIFWLDWDPITNGPLISLTSTASRGVWTQDTANKVATGYVDSPYVTFNIPDDKIIAQALLSRDLSGPGTVTLSLGEDISPPSSSTVLTVATPLATNTETYPTVLLTSGPYAPTDGVSGMFRGENITVRTILNRDSGAHNTGPTVKRCSIRGFPAVVSGTIISPVLKLYKTIEESGIERPVFSYDDYIYLEKLRLNQTPVYYQEGTKGGEGNTPINGYTGVVIITEIDWLPYKMRDDGQFGFEGDLVLYMKTLVG